MMKIIRLLFSLGNLWANFLKSFNSFHSQGCKIIFSMCKHLKESPTLKGRPEYKQESIFCNKDGAKISRRVHPFCYTGSMTTNRTKVHRISKIVTFFRIKKLLQTKDNTVCFFFDLLVCNQES